MAGNTGLLAVPEQPRWLVPFLRTEYYGNCERHGHMSKSWRNFYCIDCMSGAICQHCESSHESANHIVLQIRKASSACGVDTEQIGALIDTAGLHKFKINTAHIYFLCGRRSEESKTKSPCLFDSLCAVCQWTLPYGIPHGSKFCSIDCKLKYRPSTTHPRPAVSGGPAGEIRRVHPRRTQAGGKRRNTTEIPSRPKAAAVKPSSASGLRVGSHNKRKRDEGSNNDGADPDTCGPVPAVKDDSKVALSPAGDHTLEPKLDAHCHSRRLRRRKGTPHRSVEFVIPDERRYWFHPF